MVKIVATKIFVTDILQQDIVLKTLLFTQNILCISARIFAVFNRIINEWYGETRWDAGDLFEIYLTKSWEKIKDLFINGALIVLPVIWYLYEIKLTKCCRVFWVDTSGFIFSLLKMKQNHILDAL